jgi:uncharacterized protein YjbI with pentapeptide repeats
VESRDQPKQKQVVPTASAVLDDGTIVEMVFRGTNLQGTELQNASLDGAYLQGALLIDAYLQGASLDDAYLQGAILQSVNLQGASLDRANLQGALFHGRDPGSQPTLQDSAKLQGASLKGANLKGASLVGARLLVASLDHADLEGASLDGAYLQGASLNSTSLQGASLDGANLQGASLNGTSLQGAWGVPNQQSLEPKQLDQLKNYALEGVADDATKKRIEEALARLSALEKEVHDSIPEDNRIKHGSETKEEYQKNLADVLDKLACKPEKGGAPFVAQGLIDSLRLQAVGPNHLRDVAKRILNAISAQGLISSLRLEAVGPYYLPDVAKAEKSAADCPGVKGLGPDRTNLLRGWAAQELTEEEGKKTENFAK